MKKWIVVLIGICSLSFQVFADDYQASLSEFKKSPQTRSFFNNAYAYVVFPNIGKGGVGIGGSYGEGEVYLHDKAIGKAEMAQLTIGWQLGGQVFRQIIFLQDKRAYNEFTNGSFEFAAQASAVALTVGASLQVGTSGTGAAAGSKQAKAHYVNGYAVFTLAKGGLMYEASIGGQKFSYQPY